MRPKLTTVKERVGENEDEEVVETAIVSRRGCALRLDVRCSEVWEAQMVMPNCCVSIILHGSARVPHSDLCRAGIGELMSTTSAGRSRWKADARRRGRGPGDGQAQEVVRQEFHAEEKQATYSVPH